MRVISDVREYEQRDIPSTFHEYQHKFQDCCCKLLLIEMRVAHSYCYNRDSIFYAYFRLSMDSQNRIQSTTRNLPPADQNLDFSGLQSVSAFFSESTQNFRKKSSKVFSS